MELTPLGLEIIWKNLLHSCFFKTFDIILKLFLLTLNRLLPTGNGTIRASLEFPNIGRQFILNYSRCLNMCNFEEISKNVFTPRKEFFWKKILQCTSILNAFFCTKVQTNTMVRSIGKCKWPNLPLSGLFIKKNILEMFFYSESLSLCKALNK